MALRDTVTQLYSLLHELEKDLLKSAKGNKAAAQRVRTNTIRFEKVAKKYRKESIVCEKTTKRKTKKKSPKTRKKVTRRKKR